MLTVETALTVLGISFGVWAGVVAYGVAVIRGQLEELKSSANKTTDSLVSHVTQTERRLTLLETEFQWLKNGARMGAPHSHPE